MIVPIEAFRLRIRLRPFVAALVSGLSLGAAGYAQAASTGRQARYAPSCFSSPGRCGYPDPASRNVGASAPCRSLTPTGSIRAATLGQVIQNRNVAGTITVSAPGVTINNVCVTANGHGRLGSAAIQLVDNADGTLIEHTTVAGADAWGRSVEIAVANLSGNSATASRDYFFNCGECVHDQPWTVNDSYVVSNGMRGTGDHYEDVYCSDGTVTLNHDTLLNPQAQVADVFCDTNGGNGGRCRNHVTVGNSLLAGGGYALYPCGNASSAGSSTMSITGNRFARCTTRPFRQTSDGGWDCGASRSQTIGSGADPLGYWPYGGHYGLDSYIYCPPARGQIWSGNVWDNNGRPARC